MLIYSLLEYSHNYSLTAESLGDYYEIDKIVFYNNASDFTPASSKEFLDIQATIECGFTLKRVRDMTRTYR